jgi:hypothetical protein
MQIFTKDLAHDLSFIKNKVLSPVRVHNIIPLLTNSTNSFSYEINGDTIIKIAQNEKTKNKLIKENYVLNVLANSTSLKIPQPELHNDKYLYIKYIKIPGESINQEYLDTLDTEKKDKFCMDIAKFIYEIGAKSDIIVKSKKVNAWDRSGRNYSVEAIIKTFENNALFDNSEKAYIKSFYNKFDPYGHVKDKRFCHIDLLDKNIAFDKVRQEISGIYDFGESSIDDPHIDFAQMLITFSAEMVHKTLNYYNDISKLGLKISCVLDYYLHLYLCAFLIRWDGEDKIKSIIKKHSQSQKQY